MLLIQMTGHSGAGKTSIAQAVKNILIEKKLPLVIIDGDEYRKTLCKDLGFSKEDRHENIRRLGKLAEAYMQEGNVVIIAAINPYEAIRKELKDLYHAKTVWIHCSKEELIARDTKGLYKRALLPDEDPGKIKNLTGVNDIFEEPTAADLIILTDKEPLERSAEQLSEFIMKILKK